MGILVIMVLVAVLALVLAPYDPYPFDDRGPRSAPPSWEHPLGTGSRGGDILSEVVYGARVARLFGITTGAAVALLGAMMGIACGFLGGAVDSMIMRFCDVLFVVPRLPLMILLATYLRTTF